MAVVDPTPEEIEERTRQIREEGFVSGHGARFLPWSEKEKAKRKIGSHRAARTIPWTIPEIVLFPEDRVLVMNNFSGETNFS